MWMPPAEAGGRRDVGYGVYDLWDTGEFDQKSPCAQVQHAPRYLAAIRAIRGQGVNVAADVVLNHRMGADGAPGAGAGSATRRDH